MKFAEQVQARDSQKSTKGFINGFNDQPPWKVVSRGDVLISYSVDLSDDKVRLFRKNIHINIA